ncbi:hypothetical protein GCM10017562_61370 [Streptomyces roseofulvus]
MSFHTPWYESRIVRFRMITLWTPGPRKNPPPTMCPRVPEPMIVLSEATSISLPTGDISIVSATTMMYGSAAVAYFSSWASDVTVTVLPFRPPYVPFCPRASTEAKPSAASAAPAGTSAATALPSAPGPRPNTDP